MDGARCASTGTIWGIAMLVNERTSNFIYAGVNRQIVAVKVTGHNGSGLYIWGAYACTREGEREE